MLRLIHVTEIKPPISQLVVLNEKCLHWKAEKYEEDTEVYKVTGQSISPVTAVALCSTDFLGYEK